MADMISDYDERINNGNFEGYEESARKALKHIRENFMDYAEPPEIRGYSHTFNPYVFRNLFDELISKDGFEIDARSLRHAHGIGNNHKWDVLDEELNKVGEFWANDNMYQGIYIGTNVKGRKIDSFEICSGGFIRD